MLVTMIGFFAIMMNAAITIKTIRVHHGSLT